VPETSSRGTRLRGCRGAYLVPCKGAGKRPLAATTPAPGAVGPRRRCV
jgi:hypothetical protein